MPAAIPKPNILLIGTGGVGTIVALGLTYTDKATVSVVVRSDYKKVKEEGWEINSVDYGQLKGWKPHHIYPSVEEASQSQEFDYVVITTKNLPDVIKPEDVAASAITNGKTTIVLIQNGFDLGRPFITKYPQNYCLSGVSHIGSHNYSGVIKHTQHDKCIISYFDNANLEKSLQEAKAHEFIELYANEKNEVSFFEDVKWYRYRKLVYNATLNTVCALTRIDTGRLFMSGTLESVSVPAMKEIISIAKADGVSLPDDIVNTIVHSDDGDWFKPSMLVDVEKGNPVELEVILGNVLTVAAELKVETPILTLLYNLLKAVQFKLMEERVLIKVPKIRPENTRYFS